jgi:hypothetical protein
MKKDPTWMSGSIQNEAQASKILRDLGRAWYGLATGLAVLRLIAYFRGGTSVLGLSDPLLFCAAGLLLTRRRSRLFATLLLFYALAGLAVGIEAFVKGQNRSLWTWLLMLWLSYRSLSAVIVYHRSVGLVILRRNVAIVVSLSIAASVVVCTPAVMVLLRLQVSDDAAAEWLLVLLAAPWIVCHFALRRRFPWVRPRGTELEGAHA